MSVEPQLRLSGYDHDYTSTGAHPPRSVEDFLFAGFPSVSYQLLLRRRLSPSQCSLDLFPGGGQLVGKNPDASAVSGFHSIFGPIYAVHDCPSGEGASDQGSAIPDQASSSREE